MRISTKSRYGLRACQVLAEEYDPYDPQKPIATPTIAERTAVTESYLEQIIILLKRAGIVESVRGATGGYYLTRNPKDISLGEILRALEDGLEIVKCISAPCEDSAICKTRGVWTKIYNSINNVLNSFSLQDMLDENIEEQI